MMHRILKVVGWVLFLFLVVAGVFWWYVSMWSQEGDASFDTTVVSPAFQVGGPVVLFDQGHFNAHRLETTYAPFAALLTNDGYRLVEHANRLRAEVLDGIEILVVVNARGADEAGRRGEPAFTRDEIDAVYEWVRAGGSLLLVADHAPYGSAADGMARKFGVSMSNMDTIDPENHDPVTDNEGFLLYSVENGLLGAHPIVSGRSEDERIRSVLTFNGQSLEGSAESVSILTLGQWATDRSVDGSEVAVADRSQGLAIEVGTGRVVVLGEAAMLTAQIGHVPFEEPIVAGMNRTDVDNKQFTLNVMHWLSHVLG